ncbi:amidohydrolase family protein [Furfurilactobacillus cerevisiae]|uniref:amidohydrolase family protein n=1 Tax=Furfurilactobacillus rossiae TaxID=231049 RepID=UPI003B983F68
MKIITVEEHFESATVTNRIIGLTEKLPQAKLSPEMKHYMATTLPSDALMQDVTDYRLPFMDAHHIDMQILSYGNASPQNLAPHDAIELCQIANNQLAAVVRQYPKRFRALAVLPVGDPIAAAAELERAVVTLDFKGVLLKGNYNNQFFDNPRFFPIFEMAVKGSPPRCPSLLSPLICAKRRKQTLLRQF